MLEIGLLKEFLETDPSEILLHWCASFCCVASESRCSIVKRVDTITGGSRDIMKSGASLQRLWRKKKKIKFVITNMIIVRQNVYSFVFLSHKHCKYVFYCLSIVRRIMLHSLWFFLRIVYWIHLYPWNSIFLPILRRWIYLFKIVYSRWDNVIFNYIDQGSMEEAMNSRKFRVARNCKCGGILNY